MRVKEELSIYRGSFTVRKWFQCTFSKDTGLGVNSMGSLASFRYGTICVAVRWKLHVLGSLTPQIDLVVVNDNSRYP
jgi:hypothetical protein